jgi:hypothetical protein
MTIGGCVLSILRARKPHVDRERAIWSGEVWVVFIGLPLLAYGVRGSVMMMGLVCLPGYERHDHPDCVPGTTSVHG